MSRKIEIICTIGPASWEKQVMKNMISNGMTIARLNGAFIDIAQMQMVQELIKECCAELGKKYLEDVKILLDIKGAEVRLNKFEGELIANIGDVVQFGHDETSRIFPVSFPELYKDLKPGATMKVDKGKVALEVLSVDMENGLINSKVTKAGIIKPGRGMNLPNTFLNNHPITKIDLDQIRFALQNDWNYIAASFVRSADDIAIINNEIISVNPENKPYNLIAKIEDQFGVDNIDEIMKVVFGIMIARGDMAAEIGYEKIPEVQEMLQKKCHDANMFHIVATELLESMIMSELPNNAEVSDITKAIKANTNALMLSGETTAGKYPAECVAVFTKLINYYA